MSNHGKPAARNFPRSLLERAKVRVFQSVGTSRLRRHNRALTLIEVMTALTVICVLLAASVPSVIRTMEQAYADVAGANMKAIFSAQRMYWLENRDYSPDLATLEAEGLLDSAIVAGSSRYAYSIDSADATGFQALATRVGSTIWSGQFAVDETGAISGAVQRSGADHQITPGFQ